MLGDFKITEILVKLQHRIERKQPGEYFRELLEGFSKSIKM